MRYVNGTKLDDRIIRTDWDAGFVEGRQYGRGRTGGQVSLIILKISKSLLTAMYVDARPRHLETDFCIIKTHKV